MYWYVSCPVVCVYIYIYIYIYLNITASRNVTYGSNSYPSCQPRCYRAVIAVNHHSFPFLPLLPSFFSYIQGLPLGLVAEYSVLVKPICINNVFQWRLILDINVFLFRSFLAQAFIIFSLIASPIANILIVSLDGMAFRQIKDRTYLSSRLSSHIVHISVISSQLLNQISFSSSFNASMPCILNLI